MRGSVNFDGLKKFSEQIDEAEKLERDPHVSFDDLFNSVFMTQYTTYNSIDSFLLDAGIDPTSQEAFDAFPQKELDEFVAANSHFSSFQEMHDKAAVKYLYGALAE